MSDDIYTRQSIFNKMKDKTQYNSAIKNANELYLIPETLAMTINTLKTVSGCDATKIQVLKNTNGVIS